MALGGGDGGRLCSESPAVLVGTGAYLQRLGGTVVGYGGMDSVVGPAAAVDEGLACSVHIPADHEHQFRFNVNTISGPM